jgi:hypothetical protein
MTSAFPLTAAPNRRLSGLGVETEGLVPALPRSYHALASPCHGGHPATRRACAPRTAIRDRRPHRIAGRWPGRMAHPETWAKQGRRWKKWHLSVDDQGPIMASGVPDGHEQDPVHVPELLSQIDHEMRRFIADGLDDQPPVYTAVEAHAPGAQVSVPPRKVAVLSPAAATAPPQRDQPIASMERDGVCAWKRTSGDYAAIPRRERLRAVQTDVRWSHAGEAG